MTITAEIKIHIDFFDVDPMNVVWHGNYVKYFEQARSKLLNKIKYNYKEMEASGYSWPVVDLKVKYKKPLLLQNDYWVVASIVEYENRLKIAYEVLDSTKTEVLTRGHTIQVAVETKTSKLNYCVPQILTDNIKRRLESETV